MIYVSRGILGLFIGGIVGTNLGIGFLAVYCYFIQTKLHLPIPRVSFINVSISVSALVGAILLGGTGLIIGLIAAHLKRPEA